MANERVIRTMTAEEFAAWLKRNGCPAEIELLRDGTPTIDSATAGLQFVVFFFGAQGERQYSVVSYVAFFSVKAPLSFINRWNRTGLFGKAVLDDDGDAVLEMNICLEGVTETYLHRTFGIWQNVLISYARELSAVLGGHSAHASLGHDGQPEPDSLRLAGSGPMEHAEISRSDLSAIERYLAQIADNTRAYSGGDIQAVVNRLETANGILREIASNTRN